VHVRGIENHAEADRYSTGAFRKIPGQTGAAQERLELFYGRLVHDKNVCVIQDRSVRDKNVCVIQDKCVHDKNVCVIRDSRVHDGDVENYLKQTCA
jgi:hypothetical protein